MEIEAIATRIAPALAELGLECPGIEWTANRGGGLLRVYIETPTQDGDAARTVSVDDCEAASREISALLDVENLVAGPYTLEVSSPGIERPLFNAAQFGRFVGSEVKVTLKLPRDGRRRLRARIVGVNGPRIDLDVDGTPVDVAENDVESAHLVADWDALGYAPKAKPGKAPGTARKRNTVRRRAR